MAKRKNIIGIIAAVGMGALAMVPSLKENSIQVKQEISFNKIQQKQQTPIQAPQSSKIVNDALPSHMGGLALGGKNYGFGISPKYYGENIVRRGTHKK